MHFLKDFDTAIARITAWDMFSWREACGGGVHVFGQPGSGKTTGPGRMLAGAFLRSGAGGLVTAVKYEEVELWKSYAAEHGRASSLIIFDENEGFNFMSYELARQGMKGISSVVDCLMHIIESARKASGSAGHGGGDPFWMDSSKQWLRYTLPPLYAAFGSLSVDHIIRFITTAPRTIHEIRDASWQQHSFMYQVIDDATHRPIVPMSREALKACIDFWAEEFAAMPEKTRGNILATISTTLDRFRGDGSLSKVFCGKTTVVPELTFQGMVIVLAMPTLTWMEDGIIAQQLFKYMWQRAVLSRSSLAAKHQERFQFLWSDEAQVTVSSYDAEFLSLCRASRVCVVFMTQSLPSYYAKMGGANPRDDAHSLAGKFGNHVYCCSSCPETNEYAARMIGKAVKQRKNYSRGMSQTQSMGTSAGGSNNSSVSNGSGGSESYGSGGHSAGTSSNSGYSLSSGSNWSTNHGESYGQNESDGYSEGMENIIEPGEFGRDFKRGGPEHNYEVTGLWFQAGRRFQQSGSNFVLGRFKQR